MVMVVVMVVGVVVVMVIMVVGARNTGYPSLLPRDFGDHRPRSYNNKNPDYRGIWIRIQTWRR